MSTVNTNVKESQFSVNTVEEFERVLEIYKKSNPEKYAIKLARGEFEKYKQKLVNYKPTVEKPVEPSEPKYVGPEPVEELVEPVEPEKVKKVGRPKKLTQ